jgi:hypothetical protein
MTAANEWVSRSFTQNSEAISGYSGRSGGDSSGESLLLALAIFG